MINLKGTGVAIVTPFTKEKKIDFKALEKLILHLINGKVEYLVVLGTTGESATLSTAEKQEVVNFVVEFTNKRLPIVLGMGGNNTMEIVEQIKKQNFKGIEAILSVAPYYNKPNQTGFFQHYKAIAAASPVPVILYNVPGRTASNITAETTLKLANEIKNIIAIKEASGNLEQCMKIIQHKPKNFLVISGDDMLTLPIIACGGDGVISVVANAFPKDFAEMTRQALAGNMEKARKLHYKLTGIITLLFTDGNPAGIKAALELLGIGKQNLRLPLVNVNKQVEKELTDLIKKYN
ncbi:MAG: 4-hydroxy-tetrahydrodipicolinate synthase [Bacteroidia bacterium]